jgi:hypothetical protein
VWGCVVSHLNPPNHFRPHADGRLHSVPLEREAILQQLGRILAHPSFSHSKRYPNLLRYIVERTLKGDAYLKERTLGVEVFGRGPDYDTNEDPVVRITAGEIRKRIAQYYHEPGHEAELRIDLPPGSYCPEFQLPAERTWTENSHGTNANAAGSEASSARGRFGRRPRTYSLVAILLVMTAALGTARVKAWVSARPLDDFWGPVLDSPAPTLVCVGEPSTTLLAQQRQDSEQLRVPSDLKAADFSVSNHVHDGDHIVFSDAYTLFHLAALLGSWGKATRLQTATSTTLTDLRQGPVVLVAWFDNEWTMRIARSLRYHFDRAPDHGSVWIEDSENLSRRDWNVDLRQKYSQLTQDYAIVSRFADPTTGQPVVIAAGLGENGTIAAGEFLTDSKDMEESLKHAPKNWRKENVEIVIATQVISGRSGPPRVIATHYW